MSGLRARDLQDSTHSGPEGHGHVRVRCHPWDGLDDGSELSSIVSIGGLQPTRRTVLVLRFKGICTTFCPRPCMTLDGMGK